MLRCCARRTMGTRSACGGPPTAALVRLALDDCASMQQEGIKGGVKLIYGGMMHHAKNGSSLT
jgi:hypothetical protein